jgi:hypothetical protein
MFAEEVAREAVQGKDNSLDPSGWAKVNEAINSIQLCIFLLREPYLTPTQGQSAPFSSFHAPARS